MASVAELVARLTADTSDFMAKMQLANGQLTASDAALKKAGQSAQILGSKLTRWVTLPVLGVAAAAIKMSIDFETSMTKMASLVGVPAAELARFETQILGLAPALGKAPKELSDALYYITSAGVSGQAAIDALTASAKASAAGLGETEVVADAVTSAINAYGQENLTSARATDILIDTVRLGKAEANELAGTIGRVIPIASQMGVEFDEVGAAVAAMSLQGLDAAEAATALRGAFLAILSPSQGAEDAMMAAGISVEKLQDVVRNQGLLEGLQMLEDSVGGNATAMSAIFPNVRALNGVLNLLGANGDAVAAVFEEMALDSDATNKAFEIVSHTAGFKMKQSFAEMQVSAIKLGDILVPTATKIVSGIAAIAGVFATLPEPVQAFATGAVLALATVGPMLKLFGSLAAASELVRVKMMGTTASFISARIAASSMSPALTQLGAGLARIGIAAVGAWAMLEAGSQKLEALEKAANESASAFLGQNLAGLTSYAEAQSYLGQVTGETNAAIEEYNSISQFAVWDQKRKNQLEGMINAGLLTVDTLNAQTAATKDLQTAFGLSEQDAWAFASTQTAVAGETLTADGIMSAYRQTLIDTLDPTGELGLATDGASDEFLNAADAVASAQDALKEWGDTVRAQYDPVFALMDAQANLAGSAQSVADAQTKVNEAWASGDPAALASAQRDLEAAQQGVLKTNVDLDIAARDLALSVQDGRTSITDITADIYAWRDANRISGADADYLINKINEVTFAAVVLDQNGSPLLQPQMDLSQLGPAMQWALDRARELRAELNSSAAGRGELLTGGGGGTPTATVVSMFAPMARGGIVKAPTFIQAGESGSEAIVPLEQYDAMLSGRSGSGGGGSGGGGNTYNIHLHKTATAEDGKYIIECIKAHERRNSAGWRGGK